jgi:hypothetical protein
MARRYTIGFAQVACTVAQDLVAIKCAATCVVRIIEVRLSQSASTTSTMQRVRHSKATATLTLGSGGSTPTAIKAESGDAAAASTFHVNDTTQATTSGTKSTWFEDVFNFVSGYLWVPVPEESIFLAPGEGYVFEFPAAPASGTYDGSVTFEEIG